MSAIGYQTQASFKLNKNQWLPGVGKTPSHKCETLQQDVENSHQQDYAIWGNYLNEMFLINNKKC